jgi:chromate reductase, NAD(P)H dehydrogenase (quinone)
MALRQSLELQLGARVLPTMLSIPNAHEAFDESGALKSERNQHMASRLADQMLTAVAPRALTVQPAPPQ